MRSLWTRVGPEYDWCPRKKKRDTDTEKESYVKTEAENGVMCLQARNTKDHRQSPAATRDARNKCSLNLQQETSLPTPRLWPFGLREYERVHF